jgi:hypothetical protein
MNFAPLDSPRQGASFEPKIFDIQNFTFFVNFSKNFEKKRCKIHRRKLLNNGAMAV